MDRALLFAHPGAEHVPKPGMDVYPWNAAAHARKFLLTRARLAEPLAEGGYRAGGDLMEVGLWSEWEPPSYCGMFEHKHADQRMLPRAWHVPLINTQAPNNAQNTDPWIFGERMRYAICRQGRNRMLRNLEPGSVIFFGSVMQRDECGTKVPDLNFFLDTVFVVQSPHSWGNHPTLDVPEEADPDPLHISHSLRQLRERVAFGGLTLYNGSMLSPHRRTSPFCWSPCKPVEDDPSGVRFARPRINQLFGVKFPHKMLGYSDLPVSVAEAWQTVAAHCSSLGLSMAASVALDSPRAKS